MKWISKIALIVSFSLCFGGIAQASDFSKLGYLTEDFPPFNYKKGKQAEGIAVDLLMAMAKQANVPLKKGDIRVYSWARAYDLALKGPNKVLFSTTRSEKREDLFKWAGPIAPLRVALIGKKDGGFDISDASQIKNYKIGVVNEDFGEQLLRDAGVPDKQIDELTKPDQVAKKLISGRLQLWAYDEITAYMLLKENGADTSQFKTYYVLKEGQLYYALSKDVDDSIVASMQKALDEVKASGEYDKILAKYK